MFGSVKRSDATSRAVSGYTARYIPCSGQLPCTGFSNFDLIHETIITTSVVSSGQFKCQIQ
eukprot:scaffold67001_cov18-Prasinocladus_malaysianus.AAC.1